MGDKRKRWIKVLGVSFIFLMAMPFFLNIRSARFSYQGVPYADVHVLALLMDRAPFDDIKDELQKKPQLAHEYSKHGNSLLCFAAEYGRMDVVKLLVETHSVNVSGDGDLVKTGEGNTPLLYAVYSGDSGIVRYLMKHKADPFLCGPLGFCAYSTGLESAKPEIVAMMSALEVPESYQRVLDRIKEMSAEEFIGHLNRSMKP